MTATPEQHQIKTAANNDLADVIVLFAEALTLPSRPFERSSRLTSTGTLPCTPAAFDAAFNRLVDRLMPTLSTHFKELEGLNLGVAQNAELAKTITRLLTRLECSLVCPHCHELASALRYTKSGNAKTPVFKYWHRTKGHGGTVSTGPLELVRSQLASDYAVPKKLT